MWVAPLAAGLSVRSVTSRDRGPYSCVTAPSPETVTYSADAGSIGRLRPTVSSLEDTNSADSMPGLGDDDGMALTDRGPETGTPFSPLMLAGIVAVCSALDIC